MEKEKRKVQIEILSSSSIFQREEENKSLFKRLQVWFTFAAASKDACINIEIIVYFLESCSNVSDRKKVPSQRVGERWKIA